MIRAPNRQRWRVSYRLPPWVIGLWYLGAALVAIILLIILMQVAEGLGYWYVAQFEAIASL